jgi:hypothetical protein
MLASDAADDVEDVELEAELELVPLLIRLSIGNVPDVDDTADAIGWSP